MRKNILSKLIILLGVIAFAGCKAKKALVRPKVDSTAVVKPANNTMAARLAAIKTAQINFNTFSGKAKTKLEFNNNNNDVTLNIRIAHGQKIWVSITAIAGIEVARALITPDSILVVNKFQGVYLRKPFSYVYTYAGKQVSFGTLESLLVGNAIPGVLDNMDGTFSNDSGWTTLSGDLQELVYKLFLRSDMKVTETDLTNATANQSLKVNNTEYMQVGNYTLPSQISINSSVKGKNVAINMHYNKIELNNPLEFPFNIPSKYSPAN